MVGVLHCSIVSAAHSCRGARASDDICGRVAGELATARRRRCAASGFNRGPCLVRPLSSLGGVLSCYSRNDTLVNGMLWYLRYSVHDHGSALAGDQGPPTNCERTSQEFLAPSPLILNASGTDCPISKKCELFRVS